MLEKQQMIKKSFSIFNLILRTQGGCHEKDS